LKIGIGVITAMREELDPILDIGGGEPKWKRQKGADGFLSYVGSFPVPGRESIGVVATCAPRSGEVDAAIRTTQLTHVLREIAPHRAPFLCMTGITAGWREKDIALGDVIVAELAYAALAGKLQQGVLRHELDVGAPEEILLHWLHNFRDDSWKRAIATPRPLSRRYQVDWLLWHLQSCDVKLLSPNELGMNVPDFTKIWPVLEKQELVSHAGALLAKGKDFIDRHIRLTPLTSGPEPDRASPELHFAHVASTPYVIEHDGFFIEQAVIDRRVGAAEMEIHAFLKTCRTVGFAGFAVKGVCDYGDSAKDDAFHQYAAEASARFLHNFLVRYAGYIENFIDVAGPKEDGSRRKKTRSGKSRQTTVKKLAKPAEPPPLRLKGFYNVRELQQLKDAMIAGEYLVAFLSVSDEPPSRRYHLGHYYFVRMMDVLRVETGYRNVALMICDAFPLAAREASPTHSDRVREQVEIWSGCFARGMPVTPIGPSAMSLAIEKEDREAIVRLLELGGSLQRVGSEVLEQLRKWRFLGDRPPASTLRTLTQLANGSVGDSDGLLSIAYLMTRPPRWFSEAWFVRMLRFLSCGHAAGALGARSLYILESFKNRSAWKAMSYMAAECRIGRFPNQSYFRSLPAVTRSGPMRAADAAGVIPLRTNWREHAAQDITEDILRSIVTMFGYAAASKPGDVIDALVDAGARRLSQQ
jgi:nucleoside phosphorylase